MLNGQMGLNEILNKAKTSSPSPLEIVFGQEASMLEWNNGTIWIYTAIREYPHIKSNINEHIKHIGYYRTSARLSACHTETC